MTSLFPLRPSFSSEADVDDQFEMLIRGYLALAQHPKPEFDPAAGIEFSCEGFVVSIAPYPQDERLIVRIKVLQLDPGDPLMIGIACFCFIS